MSCNARKIEGTRLAPLPIDWGSDLDSKPVNYLDKLAPA